MGPGRARARVSTVGTGPIRASEGALGGQSPPQEFMGKFGLFNYGNMSPMGTTGTLILQIFAIQTVNTVDSGENQMTKMHILMTMTF